MLRQVEIAGVHLDADKDLRKYATKKIAGLDKYIPRHARKSATVEVKLIEAKSQGKKKCTCEVTLKLPNEIMSAKESTMNMYAAVDIVEQKLKNQIRVYKDKHTTHRHRQHNWRVRSLISRLRST